MKCPYCNKKSKWVDNSVIYGKRYGKSYMMWICFDCDARVGCHNNTQRPLGTMANKKLREWRIKAHAVVDPLWKSHTYKRNTVYRRLSDSFNKVMKKNKKLKCNHYYCRYNKKAVKNNICLYEKLGWL